MDDSRTPIGQQGWRFRDAIYANPDADEKELMHAAELEAKYAEYGG